MQPSGDPSATPVDAVIDAESSQTAQVRARLAGLDDQPTSEHAEVYDDLHCQLQEALAAARQSRA